MSDNWSTTPRYADQDPDMWDGRGVALYFWGDDTPPSHKPIPDAFAAMEAADRALVQEIEETMPPTAVAPPTIQGPFAFSLSIPIPEKVAKATPANRPPLPYAAYFDAFEANAKAGEKPHFFVPCTFYKDRPGVKIEKVNPSYVRTKIREAFNNWKKDKAEREPLFLTIIPRDGKDEGSIALAQALKIDPEPGVSVWILATDQPA